MCPLLMSGLRTACFGLVLQRVSANKVFCCKLTKICSCCTQEMIDEADRDGDGEVSEEEFFRIMKKTSLF